MWNDHWEDGNAYPGSVQGGEGLDSRRVFATEDIGCMLFYTNPMWNDHWEDDNTYQSLAHGSGFWKNQGQRVWRPRFETRYKVCVDSLIRGCRIGLLQTVINNRAGKHGIDAKIDKQIVLSMQNHNI